MDDVERDLILSEGKKIGDFEFNEHRAHQFLNIINTMISLEIESFPWKKVADENGERETVNLSIE
ncbi:hypothetical protein CVPH_0180 [Abyssogena phaseoliformis symbiont OG214]|uniref:hypothetical protein n=1 Tax=Abyssogena phaseoliformis symbiont TaxID=596095 RepID=UPI001914E92C|nr:hypothetical protein [Abyssogena phaseoliformis symbiont]BBB22351.1 hypothetical protein CVPH_0180 [Abyssogena phaseoliformis symbiont OG214]